MAASERERRLEGLTVDCMAVHKEGKRGESNELHNGDLLQLKGLSRERVFGGIKGIARGSVK
jgi:hypothetical protein